MPSMNPNIQYGFASPMMPMMAGGGVASLANQVQNKGRGPDTMLVHMAPSEVAGLQALAMAHGGSLSINPETGLPEAGFLKNLLPTLIGAGLTFFSGGAINPMTAGMLVGGFEGIRKKDLGQGILAGLGAFGGAGLGSALVSAGGQSAMMSEVAKQAAGTSAAQMGTEQGAQAIIQAGARPETFMGNLQMAGQGLSNLGQPGGISALSTGLDQAFPTMTQKALAATPTLMSVAEAGQPQYTPPEKEKSNYAGPYVPTDRDLRFPTEEERRSSREFSFFSPSNPVPGYRPYNAAQGGLMGLAAGGSFDDEPGNDGYAEGGKLEERGPIQMPGADYVAGTDPEFSHGFKPVEVQGVNSAANFDPASIGGKGSIGKLFKFILDKNKGSSNYNDLSGYEYDPQTQQLVKKASGGLTALAGGRFLQGPGDGTSDSIPAVIANKQPARLADGEFVVDARTVSELGNGSSKAGAQKLYKMMDRVHNARKKAGRGKDSKAERFMPA
jgi:hypothetical protein